MISPFHVQILIMYSIFPYLKVSSHHFIHVVTWYKKNNHRMMHAPTNKQCVYMLSNVNINEANEKYSQNIICCIDTT